MNHQSEAKKLLEKGNDDRASVVILVIIGIAGSNSEEKLGVETKGLRVVDAPTGIATVPGTGELKGVPHVSVIVMSTQHVAALKNVKVPYKVIVRHPKLAIIFQIESDLFLVFLRNRVPFGRVIRPGSIPLASSPRVTKSNQRYIFPFNIESAHARQGILVLKDEPIFKLGTSFTFGVNVRAHKRIS